MRVFFFLFLFSGTLQAREDFFRRDDFRPQQYFQKEQPKSFVKDFFDGGVKGTFLIEKPSFANIAGDIAVGFSPAYVLASLRDFTVNIKKTWETDFKEHKVDVALAAISIVPAVGEVKNLKHLKAAYQVGKEARILRETGKAVFAPALESGLTKKLQASIIHSLDDDMIVAVRKRPYQANFLDGKLPAKPAGVQVEFAYKNGVRVLEDGRRFVSDLDIAFVARNGKALPESKVMKIGEKINGNYGHAVIQHGDNYNGVRKGVPQAIKVEEKNEEVFLFTKRGFLSSDPYKSMIEKYLGRK